MRLIRKVWRSDPGSVVFFAGWVSISLLGYLVIEQVLQVTEPYAQSMLAGVVICASFFGATVTADLVELRIKERKKNNSV